MHKKAENVGIVGIEVYFPNTYVSQADLEQFDASEKVGKGKYTVGLGQTAMAFVNDREDINSIALTCVRHLMLKNNVDKHQVGRLEVGTETLLDKSKSLKTNLMTLFAGNHDLEGVTSINACYGGTNALFNSFNWVESNAWDGRLAIVVMADIAVYKKGPARPTGGAGCICFLVGPNAPITAEPVRATFMDHQYDFYKPDPCKFLFTFNRLFSQRIPDSGWSNFDIGVPKCPATKLEHF
jgi:hydroxymethylglutaryl-CoA synthase